MAPSSNGADYTGNMSKTISGRNCTTWAYRWKGVLNHKYCRNPDKEKTIWCYVKTDTGRGYEVEDCPRPACEIIVPTAIKEFIENVAKVFNIEYDTIDGMVESKQLLQNEKFSNMFRTGYNIFLMVTTSADHVEFLFETLVLNQSLDIILQIISSLMQSSDKIYLKDNLKRVANGMVKGWQPTFELKFYRGCA